MSRFVFLLAFCTLPAFVAAAPAAEPNDLAITDGGKFFSAEAIQRALRVNRQIAEFFGKEVLVETFDHIPDNKAADFTALGKDKFFSQWIDQLGRQRHVNGVVIVIVRQPGHLQIGVGNQTRQKLFTNADRDALRDLMLEHIRAKRFDQALVQGMQLVLERMWGNEHPDFRLPAERRPTSQPAATQAAPTTRPATQGTGGDSDYKADAGASH